ncbi:MAG: TIGR03905 family TSCPD domain-containing protein [Clostridiales bacterium]|nr:TIGR03905 family TSCPD domain-containing protein [Clostridiales bacterium]
MYTYKTRGTCSSAINFDIEGDIVKNVRFVGGCRGNTVGVARLCEGRTIDDVIACCKGIPCRGDTSCPDQLARALEAYKAQQAGA